MIRLLLLACFCALRLAAACNVSSWTVTEIGDTWLSSTAVWGNGLKSSDVHSVRLARAVDPSVDLTDIPGTAWSVGSSSSGLQALAGAQDLAAATTYNLVPQISLDSGSSWALDYESADCQPALCPDGAGVQAGRGYSCVSNGAGKLIPQITTLADGGMPTPATPVHAISLSDFSTVTGETRVVAVDGGSPPLCTDFETKLAAAIAAAVSGGLVEGVRVPGGAHCRPTIDAGGFDLSGQTSETGAVIIFSEPADADALPALGEQADPSLIGELGVIEFPLSAAVRLGGLITGSSGGRIRLQNLVIRIPEVEQIEPWELEITAADDVGSTVDLTLDGTIPASTMSGSSFSTLTGIHADGFEQWAFRYGLAPQRISSGTKAKVAIATPTGIENFTTGWIGGNVSKPFSSATKEAAPTLTMPAPHRWVNGFAEALTGCASGVCTVADGSHVQGTSTNFRATYQIYGSTACDGFYEATTYNQGAGTFTLAGLPGDCTGGYIRRVGTALLHGLQNVTSNPLARSCIVTFPSATEVQIHRCRGAGATITPDWTGETGTISGRISYGTENFPPLVSMTGMSQIIIERCIFYSPGPPVRLATLIAAANSSKVIVANNFVSGLVAAHPIDPISGHLGGQYRNDNGFEVTQLYDGSQASDVQIVGNTVVNSIGFFWFSPNGSSRNEHPKDVTISRNRYVMAPDLIGDSATNYGIVDNTRQWGEWKDGAERVEVSDNTVLGWPIIGVNAAHILVFQELPHSSNTAVRRLQDIGVYRNVLQAGQIASAGGVNYDGAVSPNMRVPRNFAFRGNLVNGKQVRGYPRGDQLTTPIGSDHQPFAGGNSVFRRITNLDYSRNTFLRPAADGVNASAIFMNGESEIARIRVQGNHWAHSANLYDAFYVTNFGGGSEANGWNKNYVQDGVQPSPSAAKSDNLRIPCTLGPEITDYDAANNAHSDSGSSPLAAYSGFSAPTGSADGQSCKDREALVYANGGWQPLEAYADTGADIPALVAGHRLIDAVDAWVGSTTATVSFTAPTTSEACTLRLRSVGGVWSAWTADTGSVARSAQATGLTPSTTYVYRLQCAGGPAVWGQVTTLAGGS